MSFDRLPSFFRSLAFRLTLWYAGTFAVMAAAVFFLFYLLITDAIQERVDGGLTRQISHFSTLYALKGIDAVKEAAVLDAQAAGEAQVFYRFLAPGGEIFSSSSMSYWQHITVDSSAIRQLLEGGSAVRRTVRTRGRIHRVRVIYEFIGPGIIVQVGQSMETYDRLLAAFKRIFVLTTGGVLAIAALIGWFMAQRALAGVTAVTRTARTIAAGTLDRRVPVKPRGDEIDQLAITFNAMLDRIQDLVNGTREMSDNIAHDLRSPVTRIRGLAEVTLTTRPGVSEFEAMAASTVEECDRLLGLISTLLVISRTEAGVSPVEAQSVDLSVVAMDACDLMAPSAEDKGLTLHCKAPAPAVCVADMRLVQRMVANLLDNALQYTPTGGTVTVATGATRDDAVFITVADTGVGISPQDLPHIFKRFYRCDQSRTHSGSGLGLSLVQAIATSHGGAIHVDSAPGRGSAFTVTLPCSGPKK
ncbi:MAG: ATP-binding protein [Pseudomonadota bacterium]